MSGFRKRIFIAGGFTTTFFGSGRKEFDPKKPMRSFEEYLLETAQGTIDQIDNPDFDEGVIGSFMAGRFIHQGNLPGFLPFMIPSLEGKPCTAVEGACGTGGRAIATAIRSILADLADAVFVAGFEIQNSVKAVYGADILAGASYYHKERKNGYAYFFPGVFAKRAGAYYEKYGYENARKGMAHWYEQSILNARQNSKAQEYHNQTQDLLALGMQEPNADRFVPYLNPFDCSKVSDGAASLVVLSEEGLKKCGIDRANAIEIIGMGEAEGDITMEPKDPTILCTTQRAAEKAFNNAQCKIDDLGVLELHDCFSITGLLALEAIGFAEPGKAADLVISGETRKEGKLATNLSGGLGGFGHPTGASGVRQMVDLQLQLTGKAENQAELKKNRGMMISMGGNDKTVTSFITSTVL